MSRGWPWNIRRFSHLINDKWNDFAGQIQSGSYELLDTFSLGQLSKVTDYVTNIDASFGSVKKWLPRNLVNFNRRTYDFLDSFKMPGINVTGADVFYPQGLFSPDDYNLFNSNKPRWFAKKAGWVAGGVGGFLIAGPWGGRVGGQIGAYLGSNSYYAGELLYQGLGKPALDKIVYSVENTIKDPGSFVRWMGRVPGHSKNVATEVKDALIGSPTKPDMFTSAVEDIRRGAKETISKFLKPKSVSLPW